MRRYLILLCLAAWLLATPAGAKGQPPPAPAPLIKVTALRSHAHNPDHFTQGLFFHQGYLYESTGLYGKSLLARKDPQTGQTLLQTELEDTYFGEGATLAGGRIYLLTWREHTALVFNPATLKPEGWFTYPGEGWGLTYDGQRLIRSDGSHMLYFHSLDGKAQGSLAVSDAGRPVTNLNELEWIPDQKLILANIWHAERIAAINPASGQVAFWLDISALAQEMHKNNDRVPNGIALDPSGKTLWLTGKCWPLIYEITWPPVE